jgi:demethylmenaquinone methyltransferase/2-methoxy-6-polyprenyl-1,4-benzoquinol methylase
MAAAERSSARRIDDAPDAGRALASYRARARGYDASARRTMRLRARTIAKLELAAGDCVLDVGAGTGLSFELIERAIGATGRIVALELSPDMAALARERVACECWRNVELRIGAAEDTQLPLTFDAILFNFTHDVLQSPRALENIFASAREGARIAVAGSKLYPRWLVPLNAFVRWNNAPYLTTFAGLDEPWRHLRRFVPELAIEPALFGAGYVARGVFRRTTCSA